jgi:queuine/archaeosine tRNA-ribosyltransferase
MAAVDLLAALETEVLLVSAYDVWVSHRDRRSFRLLSSLKRAIESRSILVLDSGNYEAARIRAVVPRRCNFRWTRKSFHNTCLLVSPDAAFAFDEIPTRGPVLQMVREIVNGYRNDLRILRRSCRALWPIVHLPRGIKAADVADVAADLVSRVASRTKTKLIAIPERELGDDLRMRIESVARIRAALNALNDPCALHLLGTGNPIAINAFAAAGADSFDGLEWCRTITDYDRGFLFHFRHLNLFENSTARRVRGPVAKEMMSHAESSYELRALALNIDYWQDSMRSIRGLVGSGQSEAIVRSLPFDGPSLFPPTPMSES